ncbi:hypothetical protein LMG27952_06214 [Paraburkholderia hiiakae]|uniref:DUF4148 domain-containing protein n=1 Tax=Paraburkholderia hiiakae TaxID=1081782 RepID=A0ABN7I9B2_9BURK|nr:hypothetical protein [Paraburkholderia hiiakae]CAD6556865.1 hypothetical protein LMG27952_06214 [Paraburkholderia hiiakae]
MKTRLIATLLIAFSAAAAAPAFASGYGPAPGYRPEVGAPASQRGQSLQTLAAERSDSANAATAYGGAADVTSGAGSRVTLERNSLFAHH